MKKHNIGFAGKISKKFLHSKLTPIIIFISLALGFFALWFTPKEEEPQISVPMIDIQTFAPNFEHSKEVEQKVTEMIERAVWGLDGVEYVYSSSQPYQSLVTVRFKVGEPIEPSLVKVHHKLMEVKNTLGNTINTPSVKSYSIDDVPFLTLTFSSPSLDDYKLRTLIAPFAREMSSTPDLNQVELLGGLKRSLRVVVDPKKLQEKGVTLTSVSQALLNNSSIQLAGKDWGEKNVFTVEVGGRYQNAKEIENVAIGQRGGTVIQIKDIAKVIDGPEERTRQSILFEKDKPNLAKNAVSLSFSKRKGTNVVTLSKQLIQRAQTFSQKLPPEITMSIVRDYGTTASDKTNELIEHLFLATFSVSVIIALLMGIRAALVVAIAIPVTLALTLASYYFMGFTLNRVTLFALIFSIGILVDDAIVVVENIERHVKMNKKKFFQATLDAVSEVGNPTILATFTVIAAILPMAFVKGMMGPYMKPIPVGASLAMIISLFVAFIIIPWASVRILKRHENSTQTQEKQGILDKIYKSFVSSLLERKLFASLFFSFCFLLLALSISLVYIKNVKVKMLPFDNKNEFQVLLDYPASTSLQESVTLSKILAQQIIQNKNVEMVQIFAGEPSPFSFSGMVKHTYLRHSDSQNDLQIVLKDKNDRKISSHEIIESLRSTIKTFGVQNKSVTKVLEIPPGPPVLATVVAEVYGPTKEARDEAAQAVYSTLQNEPSVVDLDYSWRKGRDRKIYEYNQFKGGQFGTNSNEISQTGVFTFSETPLMTLDDVTSPEDVSIDFSLNQKVRSSVSPFQNQTVSSFDTGIARVENVLNAPEIRSTEVLMRKNLRPVQYITSELSGSEEAPVYGIQKLSHNIHYPLQTVEVPWDTKTAVVKWDGEWFITYEVFRDLGLSFAIVLILIYVLVVGWFKSYAVPLVIMAPIPLSLIGIFPGHSLFGAFFTATSMIGFIAGAGILVRNSIILIDFIENEMKEGVPLKEAVIHAGATRFRPMLLTAAAVVVGSSVILFDSIFQGLAISLMFGEISATLFSFFVVPVLYFWFIGKKRELLFSNHIEVKNEN